MREFLLDFLLVFQEFKIWLSVFSFIVFHVEYLVLNLFDITERGIFFWYEIESTVLSCEFDPWFVLRLWSCKLVWIFSVSIIWWCKHQISSSLLLTSLQMGDIGQLLEWMGAVRAMDGIVAENSCYSDDLPGHRNAVLTLELHRVLLERLRSN